MDVVLMARNPTDSVTFGILPAARRAGLRVRVLTDDPAAHRTTYTAAPVAGDPPPVVEGCEVGDVRAVLAAIGPRPAAVLTNSDHLQVQAALVADYLGLPGKDWRSALRARDKGLMRAALATAGLDDTACVRITREAGPAVLDQVALPAVLKPADGVASEDVVLVRDRAELGRRVAEIRAHRAGDLLAEGLLIGPLHTLETLGDGGALRVWGGYRTTVSAEPWFIEERLTWSSDRPAGVVETVLAQLAALGVGFGPCHTEFVITADGPRIVEVNDRLIGDHCDFAMAELLGEPVFDDVLTVFLGGAPAPAPPTRPSPAGLVHWVLATTDGVLTAAPPRSRRTLENGVRIEYRPIRSPGRTVKVTGTNRDYLGSVQVIGPDPTSVEAATEAFLAAGRWVIE